MFWRLVSSGLSPRVETTSVSGTRETRTTTSVSLMTHLGRPFVQGSSKLQACLPSNFAVVALLTVSVFLHGRVYFEGLLYDMHRWLRRLPFELAFENLYRADTVHDPIIVALGELEISDRSAFFSVDSTEDGSKSSASDFWL